MKTFTTFGLALAVTVCLMTGAMASINTGDTVKITDGPGTNPGGSYIVTDQTPPLAAAFQTFCVEVNETFAFGVPYYVTIESDAIFGGVGVAAIGPPASAGAAGTLGVSDPLSPLTAWLFTKASQGSLAGYLSGDNDANTALQDAIWYIENEIAALPSVLATQFYNAAVAAAPTGIGDVRVLNLWTSQADAYTKPGKVQSMLVLVPEASTIAVWSVLSLVGAGIAYRRKQQS